MQAPMTIKGAQRLRAELDELKSVKRPAVIQAIAEARAHGDLKENAEYHAARARNRGGVRDAMLQRLAPDRERVRDRLAALGGIDDVGDLAVLDQVDDVRPAFDHLVDHGAVQAVVAQERGRAAGGHEGVAAADQVPGHGQQPRALPAQDMSWWPARWS